MAFAKRGQATETMMLVVSVIVALAILAALMNILGIVKIFNPSNPTDVMKSGVKSLQSGGGYGYSIPQKTSFVKGTRVNRQTIVGDTGLQVSDVTLVCGDTGAAGICVGSGTTSPITGSASGGSTLVVNNNIDAFIVICANADQAAGKPKYCISVAKEANVASTECKSPCGITD